MKDFKPMLASPADLAFLRYPLLASPKLDGIRAIVRGGRLVSRKLLDIPNRHVQEALAGLPEGTDGELIDGDATAEDVYRRTNSLVMAHDKPQIANLRLFVFDKWNESTAYINRYQQLQETRWGPFVSVLMHDEIDNRDELDEYEARMVDAGYEGIMLRDPWANYKFGRSTAKEGILLKLKRFEDSEATIVGIEEEMFNGNEAQRDKLGRTKRSTAKAGKVGKGTMGALVVRDLNTGVVFNIGSGFTAADRQAEWKPGEIVKYKYFPVGVKDKPRHPVFIGRRSNIDL